MIIRSRFKDYYDSAQSLGQSFELRYIRTTEEIPYVIYDLFPRLQIGNEWGDYWIYTSVIGFCGKVYRVIWFTLKNEMSYDWLRKGVKCYTIEDVDRFVAGLPEKEAEKYTKRNQAYSYWRKRWGQSLREEIVENFQEFEGVRDNYRYIFDEVKSPIWRTKTKDNQSFLVKNPILREFAFYKVFPPVEAFQELQMYLANQASPEKEIPKIDDKTMAEAKGFDKYSFRKDPSKKRK